MDFEGLGLSSGAEQALALCAALRVGVSLRIGKCWPSCTGPKALYSAHGVLHSAYLASVEMKTSPFVGKMPANGATIADVIVYEVQKCSVQEMQRDCSPANGSRK